MRRGLDAIVCDPCYADIIDRLRRGRRVIYGLLEELTGARGE